MWQEMAVQKLWALFQHEMKYEMNKILFYFWHIHKITTDPDPDYIS